jgi:hypothetical protein
VQGLGLPIVFATCRAGRNSKSLSDRISI